jgi:hypothetical protein
VIDIRPLPEKRDFGFSLFFFFFSAVAPGGCKLQQRVQLALLQSKEACSKGEGG